VTSAELLDTRINALLRDVPDFPSPGVLFKDIGPLLADPAGLTAVVQAIAARVAATGATVLAGIESRGFLLGAPAAVAAGVSFVPLRKAGRLPGPVEKVSYALEYGTAELECQRGLIPPGAKVLIVDDVLATGGTALAGVELIRAVGAEPVEIAVLLEIVFLGGRERLAPMPVESLARA
jgi:adenine phosphoribosyltransferase